MKLGNISQSIVSVPNFFMDMTKDIDAFKIHYRAKKNKNKVKNCNSYFTKNKLLHSNIDINTNHNPRKTNNKFSLINKEIYLPIYTKFNAQNITSKIKPKKNRVISGKSKAFQNYINFKNVTNINKKLNPDLRNDILNNTYNLIEKINSDYDLTKYSNFDSRTTFNKNYQINYSLFDNLKKSNTEKDLFRRTLKDKINSLKTINSKTKEIIKNFNENNSYLFMENNKINENQENIKNSIDYLLNSCTSNLLKLKYNNKEPYEYNKKDKIFIEDNKYLTSRINKTNIYKDFPSKTRIEFNRKKILTPKKIMKYFGQSNYITKEKYGMGEDELNNIQNDIWIRPLHHDAYKLQE